MVSPFPNFAKTGIMSRMSGVGSVLMSVFA
jgi:hypothetical protein